MLGSAAIRYTRLELQLNVHATPTITSLFSRILFPAAVPSWHINVSIYILVFYLILTVDNWILFSEKKKRFVLILFVFTYFCRAFIIFAHLFVFTKRSLSSFILNMLCFLTYSTLSFKGILNWSHYFSVLLAHLAEGPMLSSIAMCCHRVVVCRLLATGLIIET